MNIGRTTRFNRVLIYGTSRLRLLRISVLREQELDGLEAW